MINKIIDYIGSSGRFQSNPMLIENAFWYVLSSYISLINPTIEYKDKRIPINYFGISISSSGSGKTFSYNKIKDLFSTTKWEEALTMSYDKANATLPNDDIVIEGESYDLKNFLPNFENTIEGSKEGLYLRCLSQSQCFAGSINVINEEIMDVILNSNINTMKELYDGKFLGKVIKGSINKNLYGLNSNMLLFGSSTGLKKDKKIYEYFQKALNSGIYRRSFIYYQEPTTLVVNDKEPMEKVSTDYINFMIRENSNSFLKGYPTMIIVCSECYSLLDNINTELLEFSNKYLDDERFSAEVGSFDKILKLSGLHAISNAKYVIEPEDIEYAYGFYKKVRETNKTLFNVEPQHKRIYKIIKQTGKCTKTDILEKDIFNRMSFNEDINLVHEYCYKNNEQLITTGSKIKFYQVKELDKNNLNKIIISIPKTDRKEQTKDYASMFVPFNGERSIQTILERCRVSNFCLVHFDKGKRSKSNAIGKINCIGIDVDDGSLSEIKDKLDKENLVYIIYTTKNHRKEKNGFVSDRFRILLPFNITIDIEPERYSILIENICNALDINVYDEACLDISRLWFTSPNCKIYSNMSGSIFNLLLFMPDTIIDEQIMEITEFEGDDDELTRRIQGMIRWTIANTSEGNRNINLARLGLFVVDLTSDKELAKSVVLSTNSMINEPISTIEIEKTMFKSIERK